MRLLIGNCNVGFVFGFWSCFSKEYVINECFDKFISFGIRVIKFGCKCLGVFFNISVIFCVDCGFCCGFGIFWGIVFFRVFKEFIINFKSLLDCLGYFGCICYLLYFKFDG